MATLAQLAAQKQGAIPVSTAMQGESKLAAPTYQVGEKLANDVMGMVGAKNKAIGAINDASVEGAKRVAFDKNKELALYIQKVRANTNPNDPESLASAQTQISLRYAELSDVGFAFPAAMEAFDKGFTSPAAVSVATLNTGMKIEEIRLLDLENQKQVLSTIFGWVFAVIGHECMKHNSEVEGNKCASDFNGSNINETILRKHIRNILKN